MTETEPRSHAEVGGLLRGAGSGLAEQLAQRLAARIRDRLLLPGARLPSVRQCAQQQGVSVATVVSAYDQLQAQGWIRAERGRGFFVRSRDSVTAVSARLPKPRMHAPVNATALIRGMFQPLSDRAQPGMGTLPVDWLETPLLGRALRRAASAEALQEVSLRYGDPKGDAALREALVARLSDLGMQLDVQQVVTTAGATQALDIIGRTLLRPGDSVLVDELGWSVDFARLNAMGVRLLPVPRDAQGPRVEVMDELCRVHAPKLYISVSVLHNPTGVCLSPPRAHQVLRLAQQHGFWVVEDDTYAHIAPLHATRMAVLDGLQRVIYVSGFSKVLVPNWRVGFLVAPVALVDALVDTKLLSTLSTPGVLERALAWVLTQGEFRRHNQRLVQRLDQARQRTVQLATAHGCQWVSEPAGMFGWVDAGVDTEALAQRMLDHDILLAPGALFHARREPSTCMRIGFATTQDQAFWRLFARERDALAARA